VNARPSDDTQTARRFFGGLFLRVFPISLGNRATASKRDAGISSHRLIASKRAAIAFKRGVTAT